MLFRSSGTVCCRSLCESLRNRSSGRLSQATADESHCCRRGAPGCGTDEGVPAGHIAGLHLEIALSAVLGHNESLVLRLPGFGLGNVSSQSVGPSRGNSTSNQTSHGTVWHMDVDLAGQELRFSPSVAVSATELVSIAVPLEVGIRLPTFGITANQSELTVSSNASKGPVPATPIAHSPSVGLFRSMPVLSFGGAQAGSSANITFNFTLNADLDNETVCVLNLPGFGQAAAGLTLRGASREAFAAQFEDSASAVKVFLEPVSLAPLAGRGISLMIGRLALPAIGVDRTGSGITMEIRSRGQVVANTSCSVPAVGSLGAPQVIDRKCVV